MRIALGCTELTHTTSRHTTPHYVVPRHTTSHCTTPRHIGPHHVTPHHTMLHHAAPRHTAHCHHAKAEWTLSDYLLEASSPWTIMPCKPSYFCVAMQHVNTAGTVCYSSHTYSCTHARVHRHVHAHTHARTHAALTRSACAYAPAPCPHPRVCACRRCPFCFKAVPTKLYHAMESGQEL